MHLQIWCYYIHVMLDSCLSHFRISVLRIVDTQGDVFIMRGQISQVNFSPIPSLNH